MTKIRIAILNDYQHAALTFADWDSLDAEIEVFDEAFPDADAIVEQLAEFDVVVAMRERTKFPAEVLDRLDRLKLIITTGWANFGIDFDAAHSKGITICGTGYPFFSCTSELAWALILAAARQIPAEIGSVRAGGWGTSVGFGLEGRTLGLVGLGTLGARVARVGQAFDMKTIAWSQNLTAEKAAEKGVTYVSKRELFAQSDVVVVNLVLSDRTRGLVGAEDIAAMKSTAFLINTSRGPILDEDALVKALQERRIAGAGLDTVNVEPLPLGHPLRTLDNALVTPHIGYVTDGNYKVFYEEAFENIAAFAAGTPIRVLDQQTRPTTGVHTSTRPEWVLN
jgi:phosphoglycerate dehydrogenase-like enzyme